MKILKQLFGRRIKNACTCVHTDRCDCPCHRHPGLSHMIACCSLQKCNTCQKGYRMAKFKPVVS